MSSKHSFVTGDAIWVHIKEALNAKQPVRIAVPFIGLGVSKWLKLPPGSCLVTRCDLKSARAGQVSGKDLLYWHQKGVRIFNLQALHAKVFAFGQAAFIGSSNASATSRDRLVEAGVWTTEKALSRSAWDFVESLCLQQQPEECLELLADEYRPPTQYPLQGETISDADGKAPTVPNARTQDEAPMHLIRLTERDFDEAEHSAADQAKATGVRRIDKKLKAKLTSFTWPDAPSTFTVGDLVLVRVSNRKTGLDLVEPWAQVVAIRKVRDREQHVVATATISTWKDKDIDAFRHAINGKLENFLGSRGRSRIAKPGEREAVLKAWHDKNSRLML